MRLQRLTSHAAYTPWARPDEVARREAFAREAWWQACIAAQATPVWPSLVMERYDMGHSETLYRVTGMCVRPEVLP